MAGGLEPRQPQSHEKEAELDGWMVTRSPTSLPECLSRLPWLLLLILVSLGLFLILLVSNLVQVSRIHRLPLGGIQDRQENPSLAAVPQEQIHSSLEQMQQQLTYINASLAALCRPCPWDWELFQGSCYLFSRTLGSWEDSVSACQDLGAHLVIINTLAEQRFLQYLNIRNNQLTWIGLSDLRREGTWQWVDSTPLQLSFWNEGQPDNLGDEDCVELKVESWNDKSCTAQNFWICEQPSALCPRL